MSDDDDLRARLEKLGLDEVVRRLPLGVWNPQHQVIVRQWVDQKGRDLETGRYVVTGERDPERLAWIKQLEDEGFDAVNSRFDKKWKPGMDAAKFHWTNRWLIDQERVRTASETAKQEAKDKALLKHNAMTRLIAVGALVVAGASLAWQVWMFTHPVPQLPPVVNVQVQPPAPAPVAPAPKEAVAAPK